MSVAKINKLVTYTIIIILIFPAIQIYAGDPLTTENEVDSDIFGSNRSVDRGTRKGPTTVLLREGFEYGWGNFSKWHNRGVLDIRSQFDDNSHAYHGKSVFIRGDNGNNWDTAVITTYVDTTNTNTVLLDFFYAFEDIESYEHLYIDIDIDGNKNNDFSNPGWKEIHTADNGRSSTDPGDFLHKQVDLSQVKKISNVGIRFRGVFYWSYGRRDRPHGDLLALDNITVKVNYRPQPLEQTLRKSKLVIHTLTGDKGAIEFQTVDPDDHGIEGFSFTVDVRLSDNVTRKRYVDNVTNTSDKITVERIEPGLYDITFLFDPPSNYGFGLVDIRIAIFDPDELFGVVGFSLLEDVFELRDQFPVLNATVRTDRKRCNIPGRDTIVFEGEFDDQDNQSEEDFELSLRLRDLLNGTVSLLDNVSKKSGIEDLSITKKDIGKYGFRYQWDPNGSFDVSVYDIEARVRDGYGGYDTVNFSANEKAFELIKGEIENISVVPGSYNRYRPRPVFVNFTVNQELFGEDHNDPSNRTRSNDTGSNFTGYDLRNASVNVSLRGGNGSVYVLSSAGENRTGSGETEITNLTNGTFRVTLRYIGAEKLPDDVFDLHLSLSDEDGILVESDHDANPDALATFYNVEPEIIGISASKRRLNIYREPTLTLSLLFRDLDRPPISSFVFDLSLRDEENNSRQLFAGVGIEEMSGAAESVEIAPGSYRVNFSFPIDSSYAPGPYDAEATVYDGRMTSAHLSYSEAENIFELYHNTPPTAPDTLLPDETRDRTPLLHWYGAQDAETESNDLQYYLRMSKDGDAVLEWQWVGKNPFYRVNKVLDYGTYMAEIVASDGIDNSSALREEVKLFALANQPPTPPTDILPDYTLDSMPEITWSGAADADGDGLTYFIRMGTAPYGNSTLPWTEVGTDTAYQVEKEIAIGTYYVQIKVWDGKAMSYVHQELLHIIGEGNVPPSPPTEMYPQKTWDQTPNITWEGAYDVNGDNLTYHLSIGTSPGGREILPWVENLTSNYYLIEKELAIGKYYIRIKAFDGERYSVPFDGILEVTVVGNLPPLPVTNITPRFTVNSTPLIRWDAAEDPDGENGAVEYLIQIGTAKGHGNVISWYLLGHATGYQISKELSPNKIYYVQIKAFDDESYSPVAYGKLEVLVYLADIYFGQESGVVRRGDNHTFDLWILGRGTADINITISLNETDLDPYLVLERRELHIAPGIKYLIRMNVRIPKNAKVKGFHTINATCSSEFFTVYTEKGLDLEIRRANRDPDDGDYGSLKEKIYDHPYVAFAVLTALAWLLVVILMIAFIRRRRGRIPKEVLEREAGSDDMPEKTFEPTSERGVVAKKIVPSFDTLLGKKEAPKLPPGSTGPKRRELPKKKERLALPPHSVVIDMDTKEIVGRTATEAGGEEREEEEIPELDLELSNGRYVLKTGTHPSRENGTSDTEGEGATPEVATQDPYIRRSRNNGRGGKKVHSERKPDAVRKPPSPDLPPPPD